MVAKKTSKMAKRATQIVPEPGWIKDQKSKFPRRFAPYRLKGVAPGAIDKRTIAKIREHTDQQLDTLLAALSLERTTPNVWERAFFLLAVIEYGAGHIAWTPPRGPNSRAQKRTTALDKELKNAVRHWMNQGCTEPQALEKIARDPEKRKKLKLKVDPRSEKPEWERHLQTLKKRWTTVKTTPFELLQTLGNAAEGDFANWPAAIPLPPGKSK